MRTVHHDPDHWRLMYEEERARLAKLWVYYERVRRERDALREAKDVAPRSRVVEPVVVHDPPQEEGPARAAGGPSEDSAYLHDGYTLYRRDVRLNNDTLQPFYFFSTHQPRSGSPCPLPEGYVVKKNARTGLPYLQRATSSTRETKKRYRPQCGALAASGRQCRNSSRAGSHYCAAHKGYRPPSQTRLMAARHASSRGKTEDDAPGTRSSVAKEAANRRLCHALTSKANQCRIVARKGSRYCHRHKGYRPPPSLNDLRSRDTKPRVRGAADTPPVMRRPRKN